MKTFMTILSLVSIASTSFADGQGCGPQYVQIIRDTGPTISRPMGQGSEGMGEAAAVGGAGIAGLVVGGPIGGAAAAGVTAAGFGINATIRKIRQNNLAKAYNVINEAKIGDGLSLRKFISELNLQNSFDQTKNLIVDLDQKKALCSSSPLSYSEMKDLVVAIVRSAAK